MANVAARSVLRRRTIEARAKLVRIDMAMMQAQSSGLRCLVVIKMAMMVVVRTKKAIEDCGRLILVFFLNYRYDNSKKNLHHSTSFGFFTQTHQNATTT